MEADQQSVLAIGVAIGNLALSTAAGVVMLGIIPAMASFRAVGRTEPLAPVAVAAAVIAIALGVMART